MSVAIIERKFRSLIFRILRTLQYVKERVTGIDFSTPVDKESAGTGFVNDALNFESSAFVPELNKALKFLNISDTDAILDYGSGKGGVLVTLRMFPFRRICGIELSEHLLKISQKNLEKLGINDIELVHGDAQLFTSIDDFNYFYFFNPFQGQLFHSVIANIVDSYEANRRCIHLIYYYPKCHDIIMKTEKFTLVKSFISGARVLNIYKISDTNR